MKTYASNLEHGPPRVHRIWFILGLVIGELAFLIWAFKFDLSGLAVPANDSLCYLFGENEKACVELRVFICSLRLVPLVFFIFLVTRAGRTLALPAFNLMIKNKGRWHGLTLNVFGVALIIAPNFWSALSGQDRLSPLWLVILAAGTVFMILGFVLWRAPLKDWRDAGAVHLGFVLFTIGLLLPYLALKMGMQAWSMDALQHATFASSAWMLESLGYHTIFDASRSYLGINKFAVIVGHPCAGIWGILLSCSAIFTFGLLMRKQLRLDRIILILPLVALISWIFNVARIVVLVLIGANISPELAVEGFHNYAGWVSFMAIVGLIIFTLDRFPWMQISTQPKASTLKFTDDPAVARLLPFLLWLSGSLAIATIYTNPVYGYPWKVLISGGALLMVARTLPPIHLTVDIAAVFFGLLIAAVWIPVMSAAVPSESLKNLWETPWELAAWAWLFIRLAGTALLVPVIEELFFRDYLQTRIAGISERYGSIIAAVLVSGLFGALHQIFWLAFLSGLALTFIALRRRRIWDAILCHGVANLIIGIYAIWTDNLALI